MAAVKPEASERDVIQLELDMPIERDIAGGEVHAYAVMLAKGQYAHVAAYQLGIDVVLAAVGPHGTKLAEIDSPNDGWGPEEFSLLAETAET